MNSRLHPRFAALVAATTALSVLSGCGGADSGNGSSGSSGGTYSGELSRGIADDVLELAGAGADGYISWDRADKHVGKKRRVCGPVLTVYSDLGDSFLDLGEEEMDVGTFTIVARGGAKRLAAWTRDNGGRPVAACLTGTITRTGGTTQIETTRPKDLWLS